jgi:hypothetical protein
MGGFDCTWCAPKSHVSPLSVVGAAIELPPPGRHPKNARFRLLTPGPERGSAARNLSGCFKYSCERTDKTNYQSTERPVVSGTWSDDLVGLEQC